MNKPLQKIVLGIFLGSCICSCSQHSHSTTSGSNNIPVDLSQVTQQQSINFNLSIAMNTITNEIKSQLPEFSLLSTKIATAPNVLSELQEEGETGSGLIAIGTNRFIDAKFSGHDYNQLVRDHVAFDTFVVTIRHYDSAENAMQYLRESFSMRPASFVKKEFIGATLYQSSSQNNAIMILNINSNVCEVTSNGTSLPQSSMSKVLNIIVKTLSGQ